MKTTKKIKPATGMKKKPPTGMRTMTKHETTKKIKPTIALNVGQKPATGTKTTLGMIGTPQVPAVERQQKAEPANDGSRNGGISNSKTLPEWRKREKREQEWWNRRSLDLMEEVEMAERQEGLNDFVPWGAQSIEEAIGLEYTDRFNFNWVTPRRQSNSE
jgi:hypothetical protein